MNCKKIIPTLTLLSLGISSAYASNIISQFSQNPWENDFQDPSRGKTDEINGSLENLYNNGSLTVKLQAIMANRHSPVGRTDYAYDFSAFAQTGNYQGFSVGGSYMLTNPFYANAMNPQNEQQINIFIPSNKVNVLSQAFLQYTTPGKFQATAGRISMDTPWIKTTTNNPMTNATYQGVLVNAQVSDELLLTGLYINAYKGIAQSEFSDHSMYTIHNDTTQSVPNTGPAELDLTVGLGADYSPTGNTKASLWGYLFHNYVSMLYTDGSNAFNITQDSAIVLNLQGMVQSAWGTGGSVANNPSIPDALQGDPNNKTLGAKLTYMYNWFSMAIAANTLWGTNDSFKDGGIVSPYTYQIANDPLYTTSFLSGMVEKGGGNAYKISGAITILEEKLVITPSFAYYSTKQVPNSTESNFITRYYFQEPAVELDLIYAYTTVVGQDQAGSQVRVRASYTF